MLGNREVSRNKLYFLSLQEIVTFKLSGTKLDKKDFLGKSDPFLVISRSNEDQRLVLDKPSNSHQTLIY